MTSNVDRGLEEGVRPGYSRRHTVTMGGMGFTFSGRQHRENGEDGDTSCSSDTDSDHSVEDPAKRVMFSAARGRVQRVIDVALIVSNMSRLATISRRTGAYEPYQVYILIITIILSMMAQIVAGICFFISNERDAANQKVKKPIDYITFASVALVMILNIFISTFDNSWGLGPSNN